MDMDKLFAADNEEATTVSSDEVSVPSQEDVAQAEPPCVTAADVVAAFNAVAKTINGQAATDFDKNEASPIQASETEENPLSDAEVAALKRSEHVQKFKLDFEVDDIPDAEGMTDVVEEEPTAVEAEQPSADEQTVVIEEIAEDTEEPVPTKQKNSGCLPKMVFLSLIVFFSVALATFATTFIFDVFAFTRNNKSADVIIPKGADTKKVAEILKEKEMISNKFYFRIYSRVMGLDGKWQAGAFSLKADMGYPTLVNTMQALPPRETVKVMFREGLTVDEMAVILEEKGVCSQNEFLSAVQYGEYDYDFLYRIPTEEKKAEMQHRVYRLEGYLFPDTYEFYVGSLGETVVDRMLQNFEQKIGEHLLEAIKQKGWTLDEAITMASMVQGEGDTRENMDKISRVLHNRLNPKSGFTKLELCCTRDYANELVANGRGDIDNLKPAYNTYVREGFPIGPICNPGMDALLAALYPSEDATIMKCYYFATDKKLNTYFSKTYAEHQAIIKKYDIEDLG